MPFYEYLCKNCGHELEAMQKVSDSPLKKCPSCGKPQLQRLMSAPSFRLKGGGWYETDFKGGTDNKRNLAEHPDADAPKEAKDAQDAKSAESNAPDAPSAKESTAKESNLKEPAAKQPTPKEKPADKPVEKASAPKAPDKKKPLKLKRRR
jgi:putative FmdB family regulatory protein